MTLAFQARGAALSAQLAVIPHDRPVRRKVKACEFACARLLHDHVERAGETHDLIRLKVSERKLLERFR